MYVPTTSKSAILYVAMCIAMYVLPSSEKIILMVTYV